MTTPTPRARRILLPSGTRSRERPLREAIEVEATAMRGETEETGTEMAMREETGETETMAMSEREETREAAGTTTTITPPIER